jgi:D-alanyl-D-alanine dipeptidase
VKQLISKITTFYAFLFSCTINGSYASLNNEPLVEIHAVNAHVKVADAFRSRTSIASRCYVRKTVAIHLDLVQRELEPLGLSLKIMDAYRPLSVQKKLWRECPNNHYVANPKHGSRHNRGAAVDVRLVRLRDGKELTMPTTSFSRACHRNYESMKSEEMKKNCKLLELIMEKHGFIPLPTEWWHFDYHDWASYSVLDIAIKDLAARDEATSLDEQKAAATAKTTHKRKPTLKKLKQQKHLQKRKNKRRKKKHQTPQKA